MISKFCKNELPSLVEKYAKYQKVMLVFDNFNSNQEIAEIYNQIKPFCIFNKINALEKDKQEIYNGYKMLIFVCDVNSFLQFDVDISEFVNVIVSTSPQLLGFCCSNGIKTDADFFVLTDSNMLDKPAFSSLTFAKFYNKILTDYLQTEPIDFEIEELTQYTLFNVLNALPANFEFIDIPILKQQNLPYNQLPIVDLILISGFKTFFDAIKFHNLTMTDLYKHFKDDDAKINKFFELSQNDALCTLVELNYANIMTKLKQTYFKILDFVPSNLTKNELNIIIESVKNFAKNSDDVLLNYLFLYNVFGWNFANYIYIF